MSSPNNVGEKIAQIRHLKKISIADLAERSNLDSEHIKKIENNQLLPSLSPLIKISRVLGVRLGTFLDDQDQLGPVVTLANDKNKSASFSNKNKEARTHMDFFALAHGKSGRHMEPFIIDINSDASMKDLSSSHEGEEFIYVIEGKVEINYGKEAYTLSPGDSIYYDSIVTHHVHASDNGQAKILAVVYAPI